MNGPEPVVSGTIRFDPPFDRAPAELIRSEKGLWVELDEGRRARLDPTNARSEGFAQVLLGLSKRRHPVYLEIDPDTSAITRLLIPHVTRVVGIRTLDDGVLGIEFELSHGRHVLRRERPRSEELEAILRQAADKRLPLIITEDDAHVILDVRELKPGPEGFRHPFRRPEVELIRPWWRCCLNKWWWFWCFWWWFRCKTAARAQEVFDAMKATSCDPLTVPPPCIPFLYPDDGCWARAHEMCRLMINMGIKPRKVWIEGSLYAATRNNPNCGVWWGWHVAPTMCVRGRRWFSRREMVIDPSLFDTPVTKATWKSVQGDPSATLTDSAAAIYYLWGSVTDPTYTETNYYLDYYRLQLQNRSNTFGPPPYAHCP